MKTLKSIFVVTFLFFIMLTTGMREMTITPGQVEVIGGTYKAGTTSVSISSFRIDKYEVTFELWTEVRDWALKNGYTDLSEGRNGFNPAGPDNPVTEISWYDVVKWCNARSEKEGYSPVYFIDNQCKTIYRTGQINISADAVKWTAGGYRLPTEYEWEFAARGGNQTHAYNFSGSNTLADVAWCNSNSGNTTHPVGLKKPNELGIHDMSGNVYEWCWDYYATVYTTGKSIDPRGPSSSQNYARVMKGGPFYCNDMGGSITYRSCDLPARGNRTYGFRCVRN
jgi:sulfatase modifying factor 1